MIISEKQIMQLLMIASEFDNFIQELTDPNRTNRLILDDQIINSANFAQELVNKIREQQSEELKEVK